MSARAWRASLWEAGRARLELAVRRQDGQSLSEYLTVVGLTAATVIACMAMFISPVARAYVGLFRRLVLNFTSVP